MPCSAGAEHQDGARPVTSPDEHVVRSGRAVHEVPCPQPPLLALEDRHAFAGQDQEVLLLRVRVVQRARLARPEDVQVHANLREGRRLEVVALSEHPATQLEGAARAELGVHLPGGVAAFTTNSASPTGARPESRASRRASSVIRSSRQSVGRIGRSGRLPRRLFSPLNACAAAGAMPPAGRGD